MKRAVVFIVSWLQAAGMVSSVKTDIHEGSTPLLEGEPLCAPTRTSSRWDPLTD